MGRARVGRRHTARAQLRRGSSARHEQRGPLTNCRSTEAMLASNAAQALWRPCVESAPLQTPRPIGSVFPAEGGRSEERERERELGKGWVGWVSKARTSRAENALVCGPRDMTPRSSKWHSSCNVAASPNLHASPCTATTRHKKRGPPCGMIGDHNCHHMLAHTAKVQ
jgi:hypothetical protein